MSRLASIFAACRDEGRAALIGYLPTGFPDVDTSIEAMVALVEAGCDVIEVGIAYSDPGMDGPTMRRPQRSRCGVACGCGTRSARSRRSATRAATPW